MSARDLNDDCWTQVTFHLARTSIGELLKCGTISRRFQYLVDTNPFWPAVGKRLKVEPPKPRARKYRTWKSLVMPKRSTFCEKCLKNIRQQHKLYMFAEPHSVVVIVCGKCLRKHQTKELELFRRAKRAHLTRELGKLAIFGGCNIDNVYKELVDEVPRSVRLWLHDGTDTNLAFQMAVKFEELAQRRADVMQRFPEEANEYEVQCWVRTAEGDIDQIVQAIRDKWDREALVAQQFSDFEAECTVWSWVESGEGDIEQIVQVIRTRDDRRTELKNKLAVYGLSLGINSRMCNAYIDDAVGDVDLVVICSREAEWFCRCTEFHELCLVEEEYDSDDEEWCSECDTYHTPEPGWREDVELGRKLGLRQWVRDTIPNDMKSLDAFVQTLDDSSDAPPESLHSKIDALIEDRNNEAAQKAAGDNSTPNAPASDVTAQQT
ncbi:hypothetical protein HK097_010726 [Rhizophlyctis rosea]|uniref:F-box domain-containing protein n=1 Tax=Rhizophlyctis rosea TaxID=64517 RepID=A0AAD5SF50_9FUNG|nr:hypothetical protein HK097_010726 [Rhizophlyctis rosea]